MEALNTKYARKFPTHRCLILLGLSRSELACQAQLARDREWRIVMQTYFLFYDLTHNAVGK